MRRSAAFSRGTPVFPGNRSVHGVSPVGFPSLPQGGVWGRCGAAVGPLEPPLTYASNRVFWRVRAAQLRPLFPDRVVMCCPCFRFGCGLQGQGMRALRVCLWVGGKRCALRKMHSGSRGPHGRAGGRGGFFLRGLRNSSLGSGLGVVHGFGSVVCGCVFY